MGRAAGARPDGGPTCLECLPPTYWRDVSGALGTPDRVPTANPLNQAFDNGYNDTLELTDFGLSLPGTATIAGIAFTVDREADDNLASDESVLALKGGAPTGADHASSATWPMSYTEITYGGATDTWGVSWTAADVSASGYITRRRANDGSKWAE